MMLPYACEHIRQRFFDAPYPRVSFMDREQHELWTTCADHLGHTPEDPQVAVLGSTAHLPKIAGHCECGEPFGYRPAPEEGPQ